MKKIFITIVLVLVGILFPTNASAEKKINIGTIIRDEAKEQFRIYRERQRREEERRQWERNERARQRMEEERAQSRIRQEQARREALARQEQLKDIYHQERVEVAQEHIEDARIARQKNRHPQAEATNKTDMSGVGEPGINPGEVLITVRVFRNKTCQIEGEKMIFNNAKELKSYTEFAYPNQTVRVRVIKD